MNPSVDNQPNGAEKLRRETAIVRDRILIEADLLAKLLRIQSPAFDVRIEAKPMKAELRQASKLLLDGELHVVPGNAFVVSDRLVVDKRAFGEVRCGDHDAAGSFAVRCSGNVMSCGGRLERRDGFHRYR